MTGPSNGSLGTLNQGAGTVPYTPTGGFKGTDTLTYRANDGIGASPTRTVTITVPNRRPTCRGHSVQVPKGGTVTVSLTCGDPNGDSMTVVIADPPLRGSLATIDPGTAAVRYTPYEHATTNDSFVFRALDEGGLGARATVTISITPTDDPGGAPGGAGSRGAGPGRATPPGGGEGPDGADGAAAPGGQGVRLTPGPGGSYRLAVRIRPGRGALCVNSCRASVALYLPRSAKSPRARTGPRAHAASGKRPARATRIASKRLRVRGGRSVRVSVRVSPARARLLASRAKAVRAVPVQLVLRLTRGRRQRSSVRPLRVIVPRSLVVKLSR